MEPLLVLAVGALSMMFFAIMACVAGIIQDKLNAWLAQRALNKK